MCCAFFDPQSRKEIKQLLKFKETKLSSTMLYFTMLKICWMFQWLLSIRLFVHVDFLGIYVKDYNVQLLVLLTFRNKSKWNCAKKHLLDKIHDRTWNSTFYCHKDVVFFPALSRTLDFINCGKARCPSVARAALWVPPGNQLKPTGWAPYPELHPSPSTSDALTLVEGISVTIPKQWMNQSTSINLRRHEKSSILSFKHYIEKKTVVIR